MPAVPIPPTFITADENDETYWSSINKIFNKIFKIILKPCVERVTVPEILRTFSLFRLKEVYKLNCKYLIKYLK